jgi:hypothetical protein
VSLSAFLSWLRIQVRYAFLMEKASMPKRFLGNYVVMLGVHSGRPKIFLWRAMIFLSSFRRVGIEYGTT